MGLMPPCDNEGIADRHLAFVPASQIAAREGQVIAHQGTGREANEDAFSTVGVPVLIHILRIIKSAFASERRRCEGRRIIIAIAEPAGDLDTSGNELHPIAKRRRIMLLRKSAPAYKGARFDAEGFCLAHSDVRLCRLTSEGRYKVVRKTCYKCGSAALMTEPKSPRTTPHGYKKKVVRSREARVELFKKGSSGAEGGRRRRANDVAPNAHGRSKDGRRARTLSPRRGRARKQSLLRKPLSASHAERAGMSNRAIKGLTKLESHIEKTRVPNEAIRGPGNKVRPPQSQSISKRNSSESHNTKSRELTRGLNAKGREVLPKRENARTSEGVGRCRVHPEVRLAIKRTLRDDGSWQISKDICPCCFPHGPLRGVPKAAPSFDGSPRTAGSSLRARPATQPRRLPFPSAPNASEDYFSTALVLHEEGDAVPNSAAKMERAGEKKRRQVVTSGAAPAFAASPKAVKPSPRARPATPPPPRCLPFPSPSDTPEEYFATALVLHKKEDAMPNSTARMARMVRVGERKRREAEPEEHQRRRAYEAWESLPVGSSVGSVYAC